MAAQCADFRDLERLRTLSNSWFSKMPLSASLNELFKPTVRYLGSNNRLLTSEQFPESFNKPHFLSLHFLNTRYEQSSVMIKFKHATPVHTCIAFSNLGLCVHTIEQNLHSGKT